MKWKIAYLLFEQARRGGFLKRFRWWIIGFAGFASLVLVLGAWALWSALSWTTQIVTDNLPAAKSHIESQLQVAKSQLQGSENTPSPQSQTSDLTQKAEPLITRLTTTTSCLWAEAQNVNVVNLAITQDLTPLLGLWGRCQPKTPPEPTPVDWNS